MRLVLALTGMIALFAFSAGAGFAGEMTGSGKYIAGSEAAPLHGNSPCAFSGLNDNYVLGNDLPDDDGFTKNQNWGHLKQIHDLTGGANEVQLAPDFTWGCNGNEFGTKDNGPPPA